jgi:hypothetical protein
MSEHITIEKSMFEDIVKENVQLQNRINDLEEDKRLLQQDLNQLKNRSGEDD